MRLSCDPKDKGYQPWAATCRATITVDGWPLRDVVTADEAEGFAVALVRDESGELVREGEGIATQAYRGAVVIHVARRYRQAAEGVRPSPKMSAKAFAKRTAARKAQGRARLARARA